MDKVLNRIAATIHALPNPPVFINTWGDAVFAAFEEPECARWFALQLRDLFRGMDWRGFGFGFRLGKSGLAFTPGRFTPVSTQCCAKPPARGPM